MSEIVATKGCLELKLLDASWSPWAAQINRFTSDGSAYGRPGQRTYTSMSNFETMEAARAAFVKWL